MGIIDESMAMAMAVAIMMAIEPKDISEGADFEVKNRMIKTISMEMMMVMMTMEATNIPVEGADKKGASHVGEKPQVGQRLIAHDAEEGSDEQHLVDDDRDEDDEVDRDEDDEDDRDEEVEEIDLKP